MNMALMHPKPERTQVARVVNPQTALSVIAMGPDLSEEAAMRLLFPEDADAIYNPARWPWGPPAN